MSQSQVITDTEIQEEKPQVKKSDYFYYYLFWPVFQLPLWFKPNHVSSLRIFICLPLCLLMLRHHFKTAGAIFILAALMDGLDGAMARMRNQISSDGKVLDPTADKALNITVFVTFIFYVKESSYAWVILPIIVIDLLLLFTAINKYLINDHLPKLAKEHWLRHWIDNHVRVNETGANNYGKAKMVIQVVVLSAMLLFDPNANYFIHPKLGLPFSLIMMDFFLPLLTACIVLALLSLLGHLKVVDFHK